MDGVGGSGLAKYFFLDLVFMDISVAVPLIGLVTTVDAGIVAFSVDSSSNVLMRSRGDFRLSIAKAGSKKNREVKHFTYETVVYIDYLAVCLPLLINFALISVVEPEIIESDPGGRGG